MVEQQGNVHDATEAGRAWARVRTSLRESAGARLFDQWLKPIALIDEPGDGDSHIRLVDRKSRI